ncbi:MAG: DUF1848 domain-containing protein [Clostridia bacterium]|nr:DUF1848 domain-containing protein [Clostridia bacterium]
MIISASRRTDIPAFYMEWLASRIREGFVLSQNPMNRRQIRRLELDPEDVQFVFWTKNAAPMLPHLDLLAPFPYYVQFTLTPYNAAVEPGVPESEARLSAFRALSSRLGPERVLWRLDPFIWSEDFSTERLLEQFSRLARALSGYTRQCTISFVDMYRCMGGRFTAAGLRSGTREEMRALARGVRSIAGQFEIRACACCEAGIADLLPASRCVDSGLLSRIAGREIAAGATRAQRPGCTCSASTDIGAYDTCLHGCLYCYARRRRTVLPARADGPLLEAAIQL